MKTRTEATDEKALNLIKIFKPILDDFMDTKTIYYNDPHGAESHRHERQTDRKIALAAIDFTMRVLSEMQANNKYTTAEVEGNTVLVMEQEELYYWEALKDKINSINIDDLIWPDKKEAEDHERRMEEYNAPFIEATRISDEKERQRREQTTTD